MTPRRALFVVVFVIFGTLTALYATGHRAPYRAFFWAAGVDVTFKPYLPYADFDEVLSAIECHRKGVNVFISDPCDPLARPHAYSPLWLAGSLTNVGQRDVTWIGTSLVVGFLVAVIGIYRINTYGEAAIILGALLSQSSLFAMERANIDLVMILLVTGGAWVFVRGGVRRIVAYSAIFLAAVLKFYPAFGLGLALYERPRRFAVIALASILAGFAYVRLYTNTFYVIFQHIPRPGPFSDAFGGINFFVDLTAVLIPLVPNWLDPYIFILKGILYLGAIAVVLKLSFAMAPMMAAGMEEAEPTDGASAVFVAGGLILVGVFFLGQNVAYRGIWLLTILPLVMRLRHKWPRRHCYRRLWSLAVALILMLMWCESFHLHITELFGDRVGRGFVMLVREPLWWIFVTGLLTALWAQMVTIAPAATLVALLRPWFGTAKRRFWMS